MLFFDKVSKKYDNNITALEDIHFTIDKGEFSFLVGPSGAGKTTLLRLLIREEFPTSGNIFFDDIEIPTLPRKLLPAYRQKLGVVFQDMKLLSSKTLEENISFALEILGKDRKEIKETTKYLLELVKLQDRRHLFPRQLSGGEQQRAAIARALANSPDLLVADEPTGNLDPDNAMQLLNILKDINKTGTTVLVISHDRDIVNQMKTRVIRIIEGKIVSDTKGDYDSVGTPKPPEIKSKKEDVKSEEDEGKEEKIEEKKDKIKEEDKTKKEEEKKKEIKKSKKEKKKVDDNLKKLNKKVLKKLLDANIDSIELVLNLTERDLENLKLTKKEENLLEKFVRKYLNSQEK
jgi:cell division transport system ATP-binding protein